MDPDPQPALHRLMALTTGRAITMRFRTDDDDPRTLYLRVGADGDSTVFSVSPAEAGSTEDGLERLAAAALAWIGRPRPPAVIEPARPANAPIATPPATTRFTARLPRLRRA